MTEQKAKFGVLVQRGKEQYVLEGKEHEIPPSVSPPPPPEGKFCDDFVLWPCKQIKGEGSECLAYFRRICERGEEYNPEAYLISLPPVPEGEEAIVIDLGNWNFEYGYKDEDNRYGKYYDFTYLIRADGDRELFEYIVNDVPRRPDEEFTTNVWENSFQLKFNPTTPGNYTISLQLQFRIPDCSNCTFTALLPRERNWGVPWGCNWTISACVIKHMLVPAGSFDFGTIRIYETKVSDFTIKNNINTTLLADIWIEGPNALDFDIIEGPKGRATLKPYEQKDIKIKWNPQVLGNQTAKLNISCDNGYWDYCYLLGNSEKPPCEFLHIYPYEGFGEEYSFGEVLVGQNQTAKFIVSNTHTEDLYVNIKLEGDRDFRLISGDGVHQIPAGGSALPIVEFAPTSPGEKIAYLKLEPCNNSFCIKGVGKSAVIFEPWQYDFGGEKIGSCGDTIPFNIKNIGEENAEVSVSIQGDQSKNFELIEGFNGTLYAGSQETVRVRFCPLEEGDITAYLCAEVKAEGDDYINITANLYGRGCLRYITPYIEIVGTEEIKFPDTYIGNEAEEYFAIKSVGCDDASFQLEISGGSCFSVQPLNTTITLKPGQMDFYSVKFIPEQTGNFTANILVKGLNCNDLEILAHGSAISLGDVFKIEPQSYDFDVAVSSWKCSSSKNFTIYNSGSETINFTLSIKGDNSVDFVILEGEGDQSLPPNSYINTEVQFCPKSEGGQKRAFLTVEPYSPKANNVSAELIGMSLVPCQFNLTPLQYDFGSQLINSCSDEVNFTITHISGNQARLSVTLEGDAQNFTITQKPEGLFPIHGSGAIKVKYCPKSAGNHTAYLVVTPDICNGLSAVLIGKGEEAPEGAPSFNISPSSYDFGDVLQGECSSVKNFTITNNGQEAGYISTQLVGAYPEKFKIVSQVGPSKIPPGGWHSIGVQFCPDTTGDFQAQLWINTSWEFGSIPDVVASLKGSGVGGYNAEFTPTELDFGEALVGECSEEKEIKLVNTGSENMTIYIQLVDPRNFTLTQGAGYHYLTVGEEYPIRVKFCPSWSGDLSTTITAIPKEGEVYPTASLKGKGREKCLITISPSYYDFGSLYIGGHKKYSYFTVKNEGKGDTTIDLAIEGRDANDFSIESGSSGISLPSGESTQVKIGFSPMAEGDRIAYLRVKPDACGSEIAFLRGEGIEKPPCMLNASPINIDFGSIPIHTCSENVTVTVVNMDPVETDIYEISLIGDNPEDFEAPIELAGTVPAGGSIDIPVRFCPNSVGNKNAYISIKSDNCTIGVSIYLQGKGLKTESNPAWDPDPPSTNPVSGRWYAIGAVKPSQSPGYGMVISHCPKSKWLDFPTSSVFMFYLDHKGCLWMRDTSGQLWIYNLYTGKSVDFSLGGGTSPVFALGDTKSSGDKIEFCYWLDPGFVVFAESSWNGEIWSEPTIITSYPTDFAKPNMMYWYAPYYLFLNKTSDNRLTLWNANEGLVKGVTFDWSPQYAIRDDDGRIWVSAENSNILANFDKDLEDIQIQTFSASRKFNGLARNSHGDIVVVDTANEELIIQLAEEDYNKIYTIGATNIQSGAARWEGGYCLFTSSDIPFFAIHLEDFAKGGFSRAKVFGGKINNLNLRGDAGLLSFSTWKWSWKPDTKAIETFLGE